MSGTPRTYGGVSGADRQAERRERLPASRQPATRVDDLIMLGSPPPRVRELYGVGFSRAQRLAFLATVVARTEQRRIDRAEPTPQAATQSA
jgi:hypothetical protein